MWRVGRKVGRTLYRAEQLVGMMDTPELAAEAVEPRGQVGEERPDAQEERGRG